MSENKSIKAPFPGTFYRRPDPQSDDFVREGDSFEPGAVIGLVEVMKMFQEIKADKAGKVISINVENGAAVDAGTELVNFE